MGTPMALTCSIQASPRPMMFWKKKSGGMLVPSIKYNISEEASSDYQFVSTLHIKSLNSEDFAQYVCVAKNTIGKSEEIIKLYGNNRPALSNRSISLRNSLTFIMLSILVRLMVVIF